MVTTETKHKRGFFGRVWQIVFWLFQAIMIYAIFINVSVVGEIAGSGCDGSAACEAGAVIGGGLIAVTGWFIWILGTIILGILMLATRGKLVTKEV